MKDLNILKTKTTPQVAYTRNSGILEISGRSIPENSSKFYEPILDWIDIYKKAPMELTKLKIYLEYFNTGSSKYLYQIFKRFEQIHNDGKDHVVEIEWFYEKGVEELAEAGEDYKDILNIPFQILVYKE